MAAPGAGLLGSMIWHSGSRSSWSACAAEIDLAETVLPSRVVGGVWEVFKEPGRLLAASGTSDMTDAHVVICARRAGQPVVTSDPGDLRQLDPALRLIAL
jgi:hypothetical protein